MFPKISIDEIRAFLSNCGPSTKIYLGADSERFKHNGKWHADYFLCVVVHIDGSKGCKVFGEIQRDLIYEAPRKPVQRLMSEVHRVAELYGRLESTFEDLGLYDISIHLDINSDETAVSNQVMQSAIGYIKATCKIVPQCKPLSPAASFCADRLRDILDEQRKQNKQRQNQLVGT